MDKQLLKSRVDTVVNLLDSVDYYQFEYQEDYVILEIFINKICLFDSFFRKVIMVSEYVYATGWHVEFVTSDDCILNQFKLSLFINKKVYEK